MIEIENKHNQNTPDPQEPVEKFSFNKKKNRGKV